MATKGKENGSAAGRVAELERQGDVLRAELAKLQSVRLADVVRDLGKLDAAATREGKRLALEAALAEVEVELTAARALADTERQADLAAAHAAEYAASCAHLERGLRDLWTLLAPLEAKLVDVMTARARLLRVGGYNPASNEMRGAAALADGLRALRGYWRQGTLGRELLKLPALPSSEETVLAEARTQVQRSEDLLAQAKSTPASPLLQESRRQLIFDHCYGLYTARRWLATLEGKPFNDLSEEEFKRWADREAGGGTWTPDYSIAEREKMERAVRLGGSAADALR